MEALQSERTIFPFMQRSREMATQLSPKTAIPFSAWWCMHPPPPIPPFLLTQSVSQRTLPAVKTWSWKSWSLHALCTYQHEQNVTVRKLSTWYQHWITSCRALPSTGNQAELTKLQVLLSLHSLIWLTSCAQDDCHADHMQLLHALHTHIPIDHWILGMGTRLSSKKVTLWDNHSLIPRHAWRFRNETHT